ncbi:IPT/TIG domain protein [compost metagenome]
MVGGQSAYAASGEHAYRIPLKLVEGKDADAKLELRPAVVDFGSVAVGQTRLMQATLVNTGETPVSAISAQANAPFAADAAHCGTLPAGGECSVLLSFAPDALGFAAGQVTAQGNGAQASAQLLANAVPLLTDIEVSSDLWYFGNWPLGQTSDSRQLVLHNKGTKAFTFSQLGLVAGGVDYSLESGCGTQLAAGAYCTVKATFKPVDNGLRLGAFRIQGEDGSLRDVNMVGYGGMGVVAGARLSVAAAVNFGDVSVGAVPAPQRLVVTNIGTEQVAVQTPLLAGADAAAFSIESNCSGDLLPWGSCELTVSALAQSEVRRLEASILIPSSEPQSPRTVLLFENVTQEVKANLRIDPQVLRIDAPALGQAATGKVSLTNLGPDKTRILRATAFSGLLFSASPACDRELDVGEGCHVDVTYTAREPGVTEGKLDLETSSGKSAQVRLVGNLPAPSVHASPLAILFKDSQPVGTTSFAKTVSITNEGTLPLQITGISLVKPNLLEDATQFAQSNSCGAALAPNASCSVSIAFRPAEAGDIAAVLLVQSNDLARPVLSVPVSGSGRAAVSQVSLSSSSLNFGGVAVGETARLSLVARNTGNVTAQVTGMELAADSAVEFVQNNTCGQPLAPQEACAAVLTFQPKDFVQSRGELLVHLADGTTQRVAVAGTGVDSSAQPKVAILPGAVNFGYATVGRSPGYQSVTVQNKGAAVLRISSIGIVDGQGELHPFFAQSNSCGEDLPSGAECTVGLSFAPASAGNQLAYLVVTSNDPLQPTSLVELRGTAVAGSIQVSPYRVEFPAVAVGGSVERSVTVFNRSLLPAAVTGIGVRGADVFAQANACSETLATDSSCTITIAFEPREAGDVRAALVITTSDGSVLEVDLKATGLPAGAPAEPASGVVLSPSPLDFGIVKSGTTAAIPLTVRNFTAQTQVLRAVSVAGANGVFSASDACIGELAPGARCTFQAAAKAPASGTAQGTLGVSFVDSQYDMQTQMQVTGSTQAAAAAFEVSAKNVSFGLVPRETGAERFVTVRNTGEGPLRLTRTLAQTYSDITVAGCDEMLQAGASCQLAINYSGATRGPVGGTLTLSAQGAAVQQVAISGSGQEPRVAVSPGSFSFPNTGTYLRSPAQTLAISNTGTSEMKVRSVTATAGFEVSNQCPATLPAGGECQVQVQFAPTVAGAQDGQVYVSTDTRDAAFVTIPVRGTGLGASLGMTPSALSFSELPMGAFETLTVSIANSGVGTAAISGVAVPEGRGFEAVSDCPGLLASGQSCLVQVTFSPVDGGRHTADLSVTAAGQVLGTAALVGFGPPAQLALDTTTFVFPDQGVSIPSMEQYLRVTNTGTSSARVWSAAVAPGSDFEVTSQCSARLAPEESCEIGLRFTPGATGVRSGSLVVASNNSFGELRATLQGSGVAPTASVTPTSLNFGSMYAGRTKALTVAVKNTSEHPLLLSGVRGDSNFAGKVNCTMPVLPGDSCEVSITASPRTGGTLFGALTIQGTAASTLTVNAQVTATQVTLTDVSPARVPLAGNVEVALTGTGFGPAPKVTIGGTPALSVRSVSATQLYATIPAKPVGAYAVTVAEGEANPVTLSSALTYVAGPAVASISPDSGPALGGWTATVTGSQLACPLTVLVEGKPVSASACKGNTADFVVPARALNVSGAVDVQVRNEGGSSTLVGGLTYVQDAADLAFGAGAGDFGNVLKDVITSRSVLLVNNGTLPAQIRDYSIEGLPSSSFRINGGTCPTVLPAQLRAGRSCTITVEITGNEGTATGTLWVNRGSKDSAELSLAATFTQPNFVFSSAVNSTAPPVAAFDPVAALQSLGLANSPSSRTMLVFFNNVGLVAGARLTGATLTITGPQASKFKVTSALRMSSTGASGGNAGSISPDGRTVSSINTDDGAGTYPHLRLSVQYVPTTEGIDVAQMRIDYADGSFALLPLVGSALYDATASFSGTANSDTAPPADFGVLSFNVSSGTTVATKTGSFYVRNGSAVKEAVLRVTRLSIAGPDAAAFSFSACTGTRVSAQDCRPSNMTQPTAPTAMSFGVVFKPTRVGAHNATLVVEHSGINEGGVLALPLTGSSVRDVQLMVAGGADDAPIPEVVYTDGGPVPTNFPVNVPTYLRNMGTAGQVVYTGVQIEGSPAFTLTGVGLLAHAATTTTTTSYPNVRLATFNLVGADAANVKNATDLFVGLRFLPQTEGEHRATITVFHDGPGGQTTYEVVGQAENKSGLFITAQGHTEVPADYGYTSLTGQKEFTLSLSQPTAQSKVRLNSFEITGPDADQFIVMEVNITNAAGSSYPATKVFSSPVGQRSALLNAEMGASGAWSARGAVIMRHAPTRPGHHTAYLNISHSGAAGGTTFAVRAHANEYADIVAGGGFENRLTDNNFRISNLSGTGIYATSWRVGYAPGPTTGKWYVEFRVAREVTSSNSFALRFSLSSNPNILYSFDGERGRVTDYRGTQIGGTYLSGGVLRASDRLGVAFDVATNTYRWFHYQSATGTCTEQGSTQFQNPGTPYTLGISGVRVTNSNSVTVTNGAVGDYACPLPEGYAPLRNAP